MNSARLIVVTSAVTMNTLCSCDAGERVAQTMPATQGRQAAGKGSDEPQVDREDRPENFHRHA